MFHKKVILYAFNPLISGRDKKSYILTKIHKKIQK